MASGIHSIYPGFIPEGYFTPQNVKFIQDKIVHVLKQEFKQDIIIDEASIVRLMDRVLEQRIESIPRMNQRVIMYATADFRQHQVTVDRNLKLAGHYQESQLLYDASTDRGPDTQILIRPNYLGRLKAGGTLRFYFT